MKDRKIKTEYVVLLILIVALSFYLILKKSDKVHYKLPNMKSLVKEDVKKIEIARKDMNIVLMRQDEKWVIGSKNYPAAEDKIKNIVDTISNLSLTEMVSESKNYSRYGLGAEKKIAVKAYKKEGQVLREFEIGSQTSTYGHTFVKIAGDTRVYQARESFRNYFDQELDDLRDKEVMKFDKEEISEIEVMSAGVTHHFTRNVKKIEPASKEKKEKKEAAPPPEPKEEISWVTANGKVGDKSKLDSFINQLADLSCDKFIEDKTPAEFKDPIFSIKLKGNKEYTFFIFDKLEKEAKYPAVSSENPYPFLISTYKAENFTRDAGELLKKEEAEKDQS